MESVIKWVNTQKGANGQPNVVMGMSMGGLVARYALADMTKTSGTASTSTRLLITHDSPHEGANVPLGYQYLIEMAGQVSLFGETVQKLYPDYNEAIGLLNQPATQQLLLYRATSANTSVGNTFLNTTYRNKITFAQSDPQPSYKFIATSLGSQCGHSLYNPYQQIINANANAFLFLIPLLSYNFHTTAQAWAQPATGSTSQIANINLKSQFKLFGLINIFKTIYNNTGYASGNQIPVDGAPGGIEDVPIPNASLGGVVFRTYSGIINIIGYYNAYSSSVPQQLDFVPTASALDVAPFNTGALSQDFVGGTNANYPSTSSNYISQETVTQNGTTYSNNTHIEFTARNSQWLFDQMQGISDNLNCSTECSPVIAISGAPYFCGTSSVYSVNAPVGATVTWSISPLGKASLSPTTGLSTTLTKQATGSVTLTATLNNVCGGSSLPISTQVSVGNPPPNGTSDYISNQSSQFYQTFQSNLDVIVGANVVVEFNYTVSDPNYSNISWSPGSSWPPGSSYSTNGSGLEVLVESPSSQGSYQATVNLTATGPCGTLNLPIVSTATYISGYGFSAFPVANGIKISVEGPSLSSTISNELTNNMGKQPEASSAKTTTFIYAARVVDMLGRVRETSEFKQGVTNAILPTTGMLTGIYIVSVFDGKDWHNKKILVP